MKGVGGEFIVIARSQVTKQSREIATLACSSLPPKAGKRDDSKKVSQKY
mgnify:CR=1